MAWWKKDKCKLCKKALNKSDSFTMSLTTAEGEHNIEICGECSKFFNAFAEAVEKEYEDDEDEEGN